MNTLHSEGLSNGAMGRLKGDRSNTSSEKNYSLAGQLISEDKRTERLCERELEKLPVTQTRLRRVQMTLDNYMSRSPSRDHYQLNIWRISKGLRPTSAGKNNMHE